MEIRHELPGFIEPAAAPTAPPAGGPALATGAPASDIIFIVGRAGQIRFVNQDLAGVAAEEVAGTSIYDWVFPEQQAVLREHLERVFVTGQLQAHDLAGLYPDRPDLWYECRIAPTHRGGEIVSATIIARDVTHHRRTQQEWEVRYAQLSRSYEERAADLAAAQAELVQLRLKADADPGGRTRFRALIDAGAKS